MSRIPKPTTVDFETPKITGRPLYPPRPVSVSIKKWGNKPKFYAWGHINGGNNCSWTEARNALAKIWDGELLFQNAKFDLAVADEHMGLPLPPWQRVHDTMLLLFLDDPRQTEVSLKPASERLLGWKPEEQDAVADWLIANQPVHGTKIGKARGPNYFGAYIAYCPANICEPYCNGDTLRTEALFKLLWPQIKDRGMMDAYQRELKCCMVLCDMEKKGVHIDMSQLQSDSDMYHEIHAKLTKWAQRQLKSEAINIDSDRELLSALKFTGKLDESKLHPTATGKQSASKKSLADAMTDKRLQAVLAYRSELSTCLGTFMDNWLNTSKIGSSSLIYTSWNQVRQPNERGKATVGARTGRLSSTPNFQNIPNQFENWFKKYGVRPPFKLPTLPLVRSYISPVEGNVLIDRDYSQQEVRILGHYDPHGSLYEAYSDDPWMDVHEWAKGMINQLLGTDYERKPIKTIGFGLLYGMGVGLLAMQAEIDVETAAKLKKAYLTIMPGLKDMYADMKAVAAADDFITTWGGRQYRCEEPKIVKGQYRSFDYKLVNCLIQGSAADVTKEAFIRYYAIKPPGHELQLTVHDQLLVSCPAAEREEGMAVLKEAMESIELDVPLLSEGAWSNTNWDKSSMNAYDKEGELCYAA